MVCSSWVEQVSSDGECFADVATRSDTVTITMWISRCLDRVVEKRAAFRWVEGIIARRVCVALLLDAGQWA